MAIEDIRDEDYEDDGLPHAAQDKIARRRYPPIDFPLTMKPAVVNMLARWGRSQQSFEKISNILLEEFNVTAPPEMIEKVYMANPNKVIAVRREQREGATLQVDKILNKANTLLSRELSRGVRDAEKRDALDLALESGALDPKEYRKAVQKLRLLSVSDIIKIANHVTPPSRNNRPVIDIPPEEAPKEGEVIPEETLLSRQLAEAIRNQDTIAMQKLLYLKKTDGAVDPSAAPIATDDPEPSSNSRDPEA